MNQDEVEGLMNNLQAISLSDNQFANTA